MEGAAMREFTIQVEEQVYEGLMQRVGIERVGEVLTRLARPSLTDEEIEQGYAALAADEEAEQEALEWIEGTIEDFGDDEERPEAPPGRGLVGRVRSRGRRRDKED